MKFIRISGYSLLSLIFLTACGDEKTNEQNDVQLSVNETEEVEEVTKVTSSEQKDEKEVKEGPLTEIGQWKKETDGTKVTLKKIAKLDSVIDMGPIRLTLHDVKVLEKKGGSQNGNIIQVSYVTENTSESEIMFHPIKVITTNTKYQIDVSLENISGNSGGGSFYGEVIKEGYIIVPYPGEDLSDLTSLKLITGDVWNNDYPEKFSESVTEDVIF